MRERRRFQKRGTDVSARTFVIPPVTSSYRNSCYRAPPPFIIGVGYLDYDRAVNIASLFPVIRRPIEIRSRIIFLAPSPFHFIFNYVIRVFCNFRYISKRRRRRKLNLAKIISLLPYRNSVSGITNFIFTYIRSYSHVLYISKKKKIKSRKIRSIISLLPVSGITNFIFTYVRDYLRVL